LADGLLGERVPGKHAEVTFVELFFDPVFVFAVTQVSHGLAEHLAGPALFLLGALLFKFSVFRIWSIARTAGVALVTALVPLANRMSPLRVATAAAAILVFVALWETVSMLRRNRLSTQLEAQ
jgi:low temperature requirement protein LtrA